MNRMLRTSRWNRRNAADQCERGFSLVSAIFLLVVLTALGAAILNLTNVQQSSAALDIQGARAYQAARAGIEWGLYRRLRDGNPYCNPGPSSDSFALQGGTLKSFTVTVTCTRTAGATSALDRYRIHVWACNQPTAGGACPNQNASPDYVQREMQVEF